MALHRDIFWIGRQWAVTGFGLQAVDQRLKGAFDVEIARLWEDDLPRRMRALAWLNAADFNKALDMARERFPQPPRKSLPLVESVLELIQPVIGEPPKPAVSIVETAPIVETTPIMETRSLPSRPVTIDPPPVKSVLLSLHIERASAKFLPSWRVRHQRQSQKGGVTEPG
jgi:hypothetical protein